MNPSTVFRRFDHFDEALTFALSVRHDCELLQVIYSPHRPDADFQPIEGQCYGPWVVDSEPGMIRVWESVCARFEKGQRGRIDRQSAAAIERRLADAARFLPGDASDEE